ncbi:hypothetical protein JAAARDRAFT_29473 [Jaapia argillacea MUCL 33604]|uniref:BRCT domain-containing protein n=1 Tax=Jaapia argillacea MUCL 33604 TaxID=933084 RepID=A0A067QIY8_9AGAM|nr:hypothetical protein JAAARDRAFT_29473 [Jaapia argillacea MUCL 33604]
MNGDSGSLSQLPSHVPQIFVHPSGAPIRVFIDVSSVVVERPRVVRSLRHAGAVICAQADEAEIILIDSSLQEGNQVAEEWGKDVGRAILEYTWVKASTIAGRALLAADKWGGTLVAGGQPAGHGHHFSHLPTPRPTPARYAPQPSDDQLRRSPSSSQPPPSVMLPPAIQPPFSQTPLIYPALPNYNPYNQGFQTPGSSSAPPLGALMPDMMQLQQQQYAQQPLQPNVLNMSKEQMQQILSSFLDVAKQQQFMPNGIPQTMPQSIMPPTSQPTQMIPHYPQWNQWNQMQSPQFTQGHWQPPSIYEASQSSQNGFGERPSPRFPSPIRSSPLRVSKPPSSRRISSSSPSPSPPPPSTSRVKGKARADVRPTPKRHSILRHTSSSSDDSDDSQTQTTSPPHSQTQRRKILMHRQEGEVFKAPSGKPFLFHVQVDLKNRSEPVNLIKKNGGRITTEMADADYVIQAPLSSTFEAMYEQAASCGKHPIYSTFVMDCVDELALLDTEGYLIVDPNPVKRKRDAAKEREAAQKTVRKRAKKEKEKDETSKKRVRHTAPSSSSGKEAVHSVDWERSPTPPTDVVPTPSGRKLYTREQRDYFNQYGRILIKRDPDISWTTLSKKMFEKMPCHPIKSWSVFTSHNKQELEEFQRKLFIARRKASAHQNGVAAPDSSKKRDEQQAQQLYEGVGPSITTDPMRADMDFIVNFFATADDLEDVPEEAILARLESMRECKSERNWTEFYDKHDKTIAEEVHVLLQLETPNGTNAGASEHTSQVKAEDGNRP